jgi:hypothetical protein
MMAEQNFVRGALISHFIGGTGHMLTPKENYLKIMRHETPEWIPAPRMDTNPMMVMTHIERYYGTESGYDGFGVHWTYVPAGWAPMPTVGRVLMNDITKWREQVKFPDLDSYDWEAGGAEALKNYDENKISSDMCINGMFERLHACMGMEPALTALLLEPEACYEFFGAVADHKIGMMRRSKKYFKTDIFNMHDDYGTNSGLFMSLDTWRTLLKPHLKRIIDATHEEGLFYQHHSCGFIEPLIPDFVELGIDAVDIWQVCNTNIRAIKDEYQDRLTFVGGIDNQGVMENPKCNFEDKYNECKRAIDLLAPGGSYIPGMVPLSYTSDCFAALGKLMEDYGTDFYKTHPEAVR